MVLIEFLIVGAGGFIGACLRFAFMKTASYFGTSFPLGTLFSNVIAGIGIGFVIGLGVFPPKSRLFLTTGLLGGLSTFSAFSLETVNLFNEGKYFFAAANVLLNLSLSLLGVTLGMTLSKLILKNA